MESFQNQVFCGDHSLVLKDLYRAGLRDLDFIITDPKYNINVKYGAGIRDNLPVLQYLEETRSWIQAGVTLLKRGGWFIVIINEENVHYYRLLLEQADLEWRNTVIWVYAFGVNCTTKFSRCHACVLYFVKKGGKFLFNGDKMKIPSDRQKKYSDSRASPDGKMMPDVWSIPLDTTHELDDSPRGDVWKISRVCGTFKERIAGSPNQLPLELARRIIISISDKGMLGLDNHCGYGTIPLAMAQLGRHYIAIDLDPEKVKITKNRLQSILY